MRLRWRLCRWKIIDLQFVKDVADHGSEPSRWAFTNAFAAFSHVQEVYDLIKQIPVYQESEQAEKLKTFYTQVQVLPWFVGEGIKRNDPYLVIKSVTDTIFFASRLVLAHNKMLFPNHKWLMTMVKKAPRKPDNLITLMNNALEHPNAENAAAIRTCIVDYYGDHGMDWPAAIVRFIEECEWNWRDYKPPIGDC